MLRSTLVVETGPIAFDCLYDQHLAAIVFCLVKTKASDKLESRSPCRVVQFRVHPLRLEQ